MSNKENVPPMEGSKRLLNAVEETVRLLDLLLEQQSELKREISILATKQQVEDLAGDVDIIKEVVTRHSRDISELKKAQ